MNMPSPPPNYQSSKPLHSADSCTNMNDTTYGSSRQNSTLYTSFLIKDTEKQKNECSLHRIKHGKKQGRNNVSLLKVINLNTQVSPRIRKITTDALTSVLILPMLSFCLTWCLFIIVCSTMTKAMELIWKINETSFAKI